LSQSQDSVNFGIGFRKSGLNPAFQKKSLFLQRLLQNFSFATATAEKRSFVAPGAKNCKSLLQK
jgi:hypothetical protein